MIRTCRIHVLPELLVNKIAAGEVVERPASVVKELVENAIDAGAARVGIAIEEGGRQLLRVSDDGHGMSPEELRLAVMPHATSKIALEEDLYAIETMGFRGEALASISAVSRLRIVSRPPDAEEGHEIRVAGKHVESSQAAGCAPGTIVEVRGLFFNVPVRRKFLRTTGTETGHVHEQVARLALAHPRLAFEVTSNGRITHAAPANQSPLDRIAKFFGPELAEALLHVRREERGVRIEAYLAPPVHARAAAQWQYTFVNGRYIRDRFIQHAVREAYRGLMEPTRHAVVFVFLTMDPTQIDVNVHPTKIEVRWADSGLIHSQVLSALRETLQRADLVPPLRARPSPPAISEEEQDRLRREMADQFKVATPIQSTLAGSAPRAPFPGVHGPGDPPRPPLEFAGKAASGLEVWRALYQPGQTDGTMPLAEWQNLHHPAAGPYPASDVPQPPSHFPRAVQMHNLYLVVETDEGIVIIDQHALHERVLYEQLRARIASGPLESQRLLLPETIAVTPRQISLVESQAPLLRNLGIEVTPFGEDTLAVHAFPVLLKNVDVPGFMRDLLDQLAAQAGPGGTETAIHKVLDMMACKAAVKAGDALTQSEIDALVVQRQLIEKATSCPHGRPTMLRITREELNRQFHRT